MRLSLVPRGGDIQSVGGSGERGSVTVKRAQQRDHVVAASETVTLVLGEDSPLPESAADVEDLVRRLRGHVAQLGARTAWGTPVLLRAQRLCSDSVPEGYMPSRVYLVELAEATQELVTHVERGDPWALRPERRRRSWKPRINMLRGAVFAVALACLSGPLRCHGRDSNRGRRHRADSRADGLAGPPRRARSQSCRSRQGLPADPERPDLTPVTTGAPPSQCSRPP